MLPQFWAQGRNSLNVVVQLLSHVWLFVTPWTAACQASLSFTISLNVSSFLHSTSALSGMNSHSNNARMVEKLPVPSVSKGRKMHPLQFGGFEHGKVASPGWPSLCPWTPLRASRMLCEPVTWELAAPGSFPGCLESEPQVPGLQPQCSPTKEPYANRSGAPRRIVKLPLWGKGNRALEHVCVCPWHRILESKLMRELVYH